jgi:hypothetical protein
MIEQSGSAPSDLPVTRDLKRGYQLSLLIALLTAIASIAGLLLPDAVYPTAEVRQSFTANDVVNLTIGLPILLATMGVARRGGLAGLLFWPGALLYGVYNYLIYAFSVPVNAFLLLDLAIIVLSLAAILDLVGCIDARAVAAQLNGRVYERLGSGVLILFGALFLLRSIGVFAGSITGQGPISRLESGLLLADIFLSFLWIAGGVLLWLRTAQGYIWGAALLFQASALFVGLLIILIVQPFMLQLPFVPGDVAAIAVMSLICFVPFGLYLRGIARSAGTNPTQAGRLDHQLKP